MKNTPSKILSHALHDSTKDNTFTHNNKTYTKVYSSLSGQLQPSNIAESTKRKQPIVKGDLNESK